MPAKSPSFSEAVQIWLLRANGHRVRKICEKFDVDPRRLYEIWEEEKHKGSRDKAIELFQEFYPAISAATLFKIHRPCHKVVDFDPDQLILDL